MFNFSEIILKYKGRTESFTNFRLWRPRLTLRPKMSFWISFEDDFSQAAYFLYEVNKIINEQLIVLWAILFA